MEGENPVFTKNLITWLSLLEKSAPLRRVMFEVAENSTDSCDDNALLTLNALRQAHILFDAEQNIYDEDQPKLIELGREMFRLDCLSTFARAKITTINNSRTNLKLKPFHEDVEVYLVMV